MNRGSSTMWLASVMVVALAWVGFWWQLQTMGSEVVTTTDLSVVDDEVLPQVEAVTSSHELATAAGLKMLERGGTAADAAFATAAVLSVVEPWFSSVLGGGTWALYYEASTDSVTSVDGVGPVGSLATPEDYAARAGTPGMHQANVPGAWAGWLKWLEEYGALELDEVLEPAITLAREGFPVSGTMAQWLRSQREITLARPEARRIYAPDGSLVAEGDTVVQTEMADTFDALVAAYQAARPSGRAAAIEAARAYFYDGPIAAAIVAFSDAQDGYLTLDDFAGFRAELREPIYIDYSDSIRVLQNPPSSHGITMLLALQNLSGFDFSQYTADDADAIHLQAEAIKLAFADRHYHVGDPARAAVPVEGLLSQQHTERQRARIDMERALAWPIEDGYEPLPEDLANTTTFHIVDKFGNGAAVTTSLGAQFFPVADTGIHINHRMRFMQTEPGPNQVAAGFKVRHTSNPYMAFKDGELYILGGNTGADTQPQAQVQQFLNIVEFGLSAQESVARPRFLSTAWPLTVYPYRVRNVLQLEEELSAATMQSLRARGHQVEVGEGTWGNGNMIVRDIATGDLDVGTDPRSDVGLGEKKLYVDDDIITITSPNISEPE